MHLDLTNQNVKMDIFWIIFGQVRVIQQGHPGQSRLTQKYSKNNSSEEILEIYF